MKSKLGLAVLILFFGARALAVDFYSLIESSCQIHNGLIVGVTPTNVELLNLSGDYEVIPRASLNNIVIFTTIQNPIPKINMTAPLMAHAKEIDTNGDHKVEFVGWPIRFVEGLVIFYDTAGKIHVHELTDVTSIDGATSASMGSSTLTLDSKPAHLNFTDVNSQCVEAKSYKEGIGPTRIMSDKISISEFLGNFEKGFQSVESYQERTKFYARPFLYERRSKLGVIVLSQYKEVSPVLPIYFQWSTGKPYRFQSYTIFGSSPSPYLPLAEPVTGIQSDLKSHFFHAVFIGNLPALPAGSAYYLKGAAQKFPKEIEAVSNFNYAAMMGADYGPYSLSFGTYFPIFAFQVKKSDTSYTAREVLATTFSPIFRMMYTNDKFRLRATTAWSSASETSSDDTKLVVSDPSSFVSPDSFRLTGGFVRAGIDVKFSEELKLSVDEIYSVANYSESVGSSQNHFYATHYTTSASIDQSFGYYISVKGFFNYFTHKYDYAFPVDTTSTTTSDYSFGGALEFVF